MAMEAPGDGRPCACGYAAAGRPYSLLVNNEWLRGYAHTNCLVRFSGQGATLNLARAYITTRWVQTADQYKTDDTGNTSSKETLARKQGKVEVH